MLAEFCESYRSPPVNKKALQERCTQFLEEECTAPGLAHLALPPLEF